MLPKAGERFGPYEILARLGGGGMGVVFRAWDERLHREVAIKVLHEEFHKPLMRQRFLLEARAASSLMHPRICTVFDFGEQEGEPYLVMELLQGETLRDRIAQRACSTEEIVRFGKQIVEALGAAHAKGIVHRDIKPANLFIQRTESGEFIKVLDFGLAKVSMDLRSGRDSRVLELTTAGSTVGTLAYMSPEQARGEMLDPRTDLFSTGVVLYEMAARRTPFQAETTALAFQALLSRAPEPLQTWNTALPREVDRIINKLLSKDRGERYRDAQSVQVALEQLLARGRGEWLRKLPAAVVPLVPAPDPRLRGRSSRGSRSKPTAEGNESSAERPGATGSGERSAATSGGEKLSSGVQPFSRAEVLKPRRLPRQERDPLEIQHPDEGPRAPSSRGDLPKGASQPSMPAAEGREASEQSGRDLTARRDEVFAPPAGLSSRPVTAERVSRLPPDITKARTGSGTTNPLASRATQLAPQEHSAAAQGTEEGSVDPVAPLQGWWRRRGWLVALGVLVVGLLYLVVSHVRSSSSRRVVLGPNDRLLLGPIEDGTDSGLAKGVNAGIELALADRSQLPWMGTDAYRAGQRVAATAGASGLDATSAQGIARALNARVYTRGELRQDSSHLVLQLGLYDTTSNDRLALIKEEAASPDDLPHAAKSLALELERMCGEAEQPSDASSRNATEHLPSLAALAAFEEGETRWSDGDAFGAIDSYRKATDADPEFAKAYLRLSWLYGGQNAEIAAVDMAASATVAAPHGSLRLQHLARVTRLARLEQDLPGALQAARLATADRTHDPEILTLLARMNRLNGHMTEALLAAQNALSLDPYNVSSMDEATLAAIGSNRFDEARSIARQARDKGILCDCGQQLLNPMEANVGQEQLSSPHDLRPLWERAVVLEVSGEREAAKVWWHKVADLARARGDIDSAAPAALATEALNDALQGDCSAAVGSAHEASLLPYGRTAAYHLALAAAVCGALERPDGQEALQRIEAGGHPTPLGKNVQLPLVHGAALIASHDTAQAAMTLTQLPITRETLPLSLYLHGVALDAAGAHPAATEAFSLAAQAKGYALLSGVPVVTLAERRLEQTEPVQGSTAHSTTRHGRVF